MEFNGFLIRQSKGTWFEPSKTFAAFNAFLLSQDPEVLCMTEARAKASSPSDRGRPAAEEQRIFKMARNFDFNALSCAVGENSSDNEGYDKDEGLDSSIGRIENALQRFHVHWSLADKRYAGTCLLVNRRVGAPMATPGADWGEQKGAPSYGVVASFHDARAEFAAYETSISGSDDDAIVEAAAVTRIASVEAEKRGVAFRPAPDDTVALTVFSTADCETSANKHPSRLRRRHQPP